RSTRVVPLEIASNVRPLSRSCFCSSKITVALLLVSWQYLALTPGFRGHHLEHPYAGRPSSNGHRPHRCAEWRMTRTGQHEGGPVSLLLCECRRRPRGRDQACE